MSTMVQRSVYLDNNDFACFSETVELSNKGVHPVVEIVSCLFAYIGVCFYYMYSGVVNLISSIILVLH